MHIRLVSAKLRRHAVALALAGLLLTAGTTSAGAAGFRMFSASLSTSSVTGEKPQSKIFYHDGSYWAVLRGPEGVAIYEKVGNEWQRGAFMDAVLSSGGNADVKWDGRTLFVLVYSTSPKLFELTYDAAIRTWNLTTGFPVSMPRPSGSETMVLEEDSTGRLWAVAEGNNDIDAYYTTSGDHRRWSSAPVVLRTGVNSDDIASVVAFGGDKIGVFWSDQNRDEFGFRVHHDGDSPTLWDAPEIADSGSGHADDHIHLAADSQGRVYAITKDDFDRLAVHRRDTSRLWTTKPDVVGTIGTRGIVMIDEPDDKVYILYTRWDRNPNTIEYSSTRLDGLAFGEPTLLMSAAKGLNNVSGLKQGLPPGNLIAVAEGDGAVWWNGWGAPLPAPAPAPAAPLGLAASLLEAPSRVDLAWSPPAGTSVTGYFVYRQVDGGGFARLVSGPIPDPAFTDSALVTGSLCYRVAAFASGQEGSASDVACVTYAPPPPPPPGAPRGLTASRTEISVTGSATGAAAYRMDENTGQSLEDATGLGHTAQLGSGPGVDNADPTWIARLTGGCLAFDGSNDRAMIPDALDLRFEASFTLEAWVRRSKTGYADCILSKGDSGRRNYWLQIDSSNRVDFRWQSPGPKDHILTSAATITDLEWHHVACVYDQTAGEDRIYIDGRIVQRKPDSGTPTSDGSPVYIGARLLAGSLKNSFHGSIDLPRVSPGVLYTSDFVPPAGFGSSALQSVVQLAWQAPDSASICGYKVCRRAQGDSIAVQVCTGVVTSLTWIDANPPGAEACYRVTAVDGFAQEGPASDEACVSGAAAKPLSTRPAVEAAAAPRLSAHPNPFNPVTTIRFGLREPRRVVLAVFDVRGQRVTTLVEGALPPGPHEAQWLGRDAGNVPVASGVYFAVLRAGDDSQRLKLILLK